MPGDPAATPQPPAVPKTRWEIAASLVGLFAPALQAAGLITGTTDAARRNDPVMFGVAITLAVASLASLLFLWVRNPSGSTRGPATFMSLLTGVAAVLLFVLLIGRTGATDTRPVITAISAPPVDAARTGPTVPVRAAGVPR